MWFWNIFFVSLFESKFNSEELKELYVLNRCKYLGASYEDEIILAWFKYNQINNQSKKELLPANWTFFLLEIAIWDQKITLFA